MEKIENLTPMVVFARVVETLSFTETALSLGMSKSSVSRDIATLEKRIGAMLLKRTIRKIEITELGLSYYQHCFKILNELRAAERFIRDYYEEPTGTIKILAPVTFGKEYVVPALNAYLERNIMANVDLDLSDKTVDIKESQYDLSIIVDQDTPTQETSNFYAPSSGGFMPPLTLSPGCVLF